MKKVQAYLIILLFCFSLNLYPQVPGWQWARGINSGGHEIAKDVATEHVTGNIYMVGAWRNDLSAYFPGDSYAGTDFSLTYGGEDGLVVKYDQNGTILWAFKIGGSGDDEVSAITIDSSGNIYITGYIDNGTNYFSGTSSSTPDSIITNPSGLDFFIAKYNPDGALLWVRHSDGSSGDAKGLGIYAENSSVFTSGYCTGSTSFGSFSGSFNQGNEDYFVAKYDVNGSEQWLLEGGSDGSDFAYDVLSDGINVYFLGSFMGNTLSVPDTSGTNVVSMTNASSGNSEIFILSFDVNSNYNWGQKISSIEDDNGYGITHDADSLYITGGISNSANFPGYINNPVTVSSKKDIFISSHSKTNGNTGWVRVVTCTANGDEEGLDIVIDITDSIYVTGYFSQDLNFGDTIIMSTGNDDIFVASFLDNGTFNWVKMAGSIGGGDIGYGISTDNSTNIYIAGHYNQEAFFDAHRLPDSGGLNIFLANIELDACINAEGGTASTAQDHICLSESTTILLTGYYGIIQWQSSPYGSNNWTDISGENAPTLVVSPNDTTDYRAFLTSDPCQPDPSNTITIYLYEQPAANAGQDVSLCSGEESELNASGGVTYSWSPETGLSNSNIADPIVSPTTTTLYTLTITDLNGCEDFDELTVVVHKQPTANAGPDQELDYIFETTMEAELNSSESGEWSVVSGSGDFEDNQSPITKVIGLSLGENIFFWKVTNGVCPEAADEVKITVNDFLVPSVITPNGDMKNDFFVIRGIDISGSIELTVFNRWSAEVYKNNIYKNNWDGRDHHGNELPADTYFYVIKLVDGRVLKGFVVIKR